MPVTYGVFAIKGGTGKSTTFDMLATSLELPDVIDGSLKQIPPGGRKVCTLDLDSQGGTLHVTNNVPDAEVCLIDTPGALSPKLPIWVANVDVPIVVTRATSRDIEPDRKSVV